MLVDHHCHLDFPDFESERGAYVARARAAGVGILVTISTLVSRHETYRAIAEAHDGVYCTVGTHPHRADEEADVTVDTLVRLSEHPKCVGIGEAGLDFYYKKSSPQGQEAGFRRHIEAARLTGLPLEIHTRDADGDTARILEDEMAKGPFKALLHCFTGSTEFARKAVALGLYVSFSGVVTFKKSQALRDLAAELPLDRLLVETDAPFLAPEPYRGKRNEPAFVVHTAAALAKVRGLDEATFAAATTENFHRLYAKVPRQGQGTPS